MGKYRDVVLVLLINFLYHTMNQMFVPTLPVYITGLGGDEVVVGAIVGLLSLGAIIAKVFFGKLATRSSNLLVLRIGLLVATCVLVLYQPFWGFGFLALVRLIQSIGLAGFITGAQGVLSDNTKPHNRGFLFGIFSSMVGLGMAVGPLLGSYLADTFSYSVFFWGTSVVVGIAMLFSFFMKGKPLASGPGMGRKYQPHSPWKNPKLLVVSGSMFLAASVMGATASILTLHALAVGIAIPGLFFVLFASTFTLSGATAGFLSDRFGRSTLIIPGFCLLIAGLLLLSFLNGLVILVTSAILCGIGFGFVNTVLLAMVPGYSMNPVDAANDLAFFSNAFDLGVVLGSIGLSWLAAHSYGLFWLAVAGANVIGLLFYLRHNPEREKKKKAQH
ncbi:MAG TPA: MFS transporter [Limnochordia bacterium]|jgi:MFS family permease|nr:MFS transporter [Bacillota bacterium]HKM43601.1 MFS transporter [Limnochordia bacterium]